MLPPVAQKTNSGLSDSSVPSPTTSMILSLPNEILFHIFSFLPGPSHRGSLVSYTANNKCYTVSQMLLLRLVCCRFRAIATELDFWYDVNFIFGELVPNLYVDHRISVRNLREERFLEVLFGDAALVNSFGRRKTDWKFQSIEALNAVVECVPLFKENARVIYLEILMQYAGPDTVPSPVDIAIKNLAVCSAVKKLWINFADNIDLDAVANSFPSLETLGIYQNGSCRGSLERLKHLRKLVVHNWVGRISDLRYLPLNSAEALTELQLECGGVGKLIFDTSSLDAFINLKSLIIGPLCDSICDFIIRSQIHLDVFKASILQKYVRIDEIVNMLRAKSLRKLKQFGFSNWMDDERCDVVAMKRFWFYIFHAFTSLLLSVEEVQLTAPFHLRLCSLFARMRNLKLLNWDVTTNPVFGCRGSDDLKEIKGAFDAAFMNFGEKPRLVIRLLALSPSYRIA